MRSVEEGRLPVESASFRTHISRCLGCRACESACPAGVEYGHLLEAARSDIAAVAPPRGATARLLNFALRHVWPRPRRLRLAFKLARLFRDCGVPRLLRASGVSRLLPARAALALALLEASASAPLGLEGRVAGGESSDRAGGLDTPSADGAVAPTTSTEKALLFTGCVMEGLFARVNRATGRVLAANGCAASAPGGQVCCGALHAHAGDLEGARRLALQNIDAFGDDTEAPVVTNAGGCGAMLASYDKLFAEGDEYAERARRFAARVRDVSQQLEAAPLREGAPLGDSEAVTYDASCHLIHGQRAFAAPLKLLAAIPRLRFVPLEGSDVCCGGAGVYNLLEEEMAARVLGEKLARIGDTGARVLATGNPGCHMQIGAGARLAGSDLRVCHPVELLDASYRRAGFYDAGESE
jgi:glycolate oxidase iron-sulfur subunit